MSETTESPVARIPIRSPPHPCAEDHHRVEQDKHQRGVPHRHNELTNSGNNSDEDAGNKHLQRITRESRAWQSMHLHHSSHTCLPRVIEVNHLTLSNYGTRNSTMPCVSCYRSPAPSYTHRNCTRKIFISAARNNRSLSCGMTGIMLIHLC